MVGPRGRRPAAPRPSGWRRPDGGAGRRDHVLHPHGGGGAVHDPAPGPGGDILLRSAGHRVRIPGASRPGVPLPSGHAGDRTESARAGRGDVERACGRHRRRLGRGPAAAGRARRMAGSRRRRRPPRVPLGTPPLSRTADPVPMRAEKASRYASMVPVGTVAGWWAGRSDPQRIALYTRWSYYSVLALTPFFALLVVVSSADQRPFAAVLFLLGSIAVTVTVLLLARAGLAAPGPDKRLPPRLLVGAAAATLATAGAGVAAVPDGGDAGSLLPWVLGLAPTMVLIACSTVWPTRTLAFGGVGVGVFVGVGLLTDGRPAAEALVVGVLFAVTSIATASSFRFYVWVLDVVTQLERARDVQARLAVAEE